MPTTTEWTKERQRLEDNAYYARQGYSRALADRGGQEGEDFLAYWREKQKKAAAELYFYKQAHPEEAE